MLHVHPLLDNGLVNKFPRRQILGKQSVAGLRNNSDNRRSVFNVVRAMPSAKLRVQVYTGVCVDKS
jgi:hypothetical protein